MLFVETFPPTKNLEERVKNFFESEKVRLKEAVGEIENTSVEIAGTSESLDPSAYLTTEEKIFKMIDYCIYRLTKRLEKRSVNVPYAITKEEIVYARVRLCFPLILFFTIGIKSDGTIFPTCVW
jgi:hypothetical protein